MSGTLIRSLFPSGIETEEMDPRTIDAVEELLLCGEEQAIERAVPKRRQQFAAGRVCARRALHRLGVDTPPAILRRDDRAPVWPKGFSGSISHTDSWCGVAVAPVEQARSIGLDVEQVGPLKDALIDKICTARERDFLASLPLEDRGATAKLIFSAKECAYKCQYPLTETYFGFHAMEVDLDRDAKSFVATLQKDAGSFRAGDTIRGSYLIEQDLVVTGCLLPSTQGPGD